MADVHIVRNVRIPLSLDTEIRRIAEFEDRTISKVIQRLLERAVYKYLRDNEQGMIESEELRAQFKKRPENEHNREHNRPE